MFYQFDRYILAAYFLYLVCYTLIIIDLFWNYKYKFMDVVQVKSMVRVIISSSAELLSWF